MVWSPALKGGGRFAIAYLLACAITLAIFPQGSLDHSDPIFLYLVALLAVASVWPAWRFAQETLGCPSRMQHLQLALWSLLGCLPTWCLAAAVIASWTIKGPVSLQAFGAAVTGEAWLAILFFLAIGLIAHALALRITYGVLVGVFSVMVAMTSPEARQRQRETERDILGGIFSALWMTLSPSARRRQREGAEEATRKLDEFDLESVKRWSALDQPIKDKRRT